MKRPKYANKKGQYLQGEFYSHLLNKMVTYRSSYELRFLELLERDEDVVHYEVETLQVPYVDRYGKQRCYIPDFLVMYKDGSIEICEIKPVAMCLDNTIRRKACACVEYIKKHLGDEDLDVVYRFVTERDLFEDRKDYREHIKRPKRKR